MKKTKKKTERPLTTKLQRFAELYDGNGTQTARLAGYQGSDVALAVAAKRALSNDKVLKIIEKRERKYIKKNIMSMNEIREFWTDAIKQAKQSDGSIKLDQNILKAAHDLTKSKGGFLDRLEVGATQEKALEELLDDEQ